jgi:hypothetical protein
MNPILVISVVSFIVMFSMAVWVAEAAVAEARLVPTRYCVQ